MFKCNQQDGNFNDIDKELWNHTSSIKDNFECNLGNARILFEKISVSTEIFPLNFIKLEQRTLNNFQKKKNYLKLMRKLTGFRKPNYRFQLIKKKDTVLNGAYFGENVFS